MRSNYFPGYRIFSAILVALTLLTGGIVPMASASDYEGAITAKLSEIQAKQAELLAA
ncbi:MAG: hypothetical protein M0P74_05430 [Syntrophales bacterium]|nr:hypothetical protein [Syntrophales bacterium]